MANIYTDPITGKQVYDDPQKGMVIDAKTAQPIRPIGSGGQQAAPVQTKTVALGTGQQVQVDQKGNIVGQPSPLPSQQTTGQTTVGTQATTPVGQWEQLGTQPAAQPYTLPSNLTFTSPQAVAPTAKTLPPAPKTGGLMAFATALTQATNLATQKRAELSAQFLGAVPQGVAPASDFSGIIGGLQRAGVSYGRELTGAALDEARREQDLAIEEWRYQRSQVEAENERARVAFENEKSNIQTLAISLAEKGIDPSVITSVVNAPNLSTAIQIASGALQASSKGSYSLLTEGDTVYELQKDKDGQVIAKRIIMQGTKSATEPEVREINGSLYQFNPSTGKWDVAVQGTQKSGLTEVSPGATLYDPITGQSVYTAPTAKQLGGEAPGTPTSVSERQAILRQNAIALARPELEASRGSDGYVDPKVYMQLRQDYAEAIGDVNEFDDTFASMLSPQERANLGVGKATGLKAEMPAEEQAGGGVWGYISNLF